MGARKLSKRGQAEEQSPQGARSAGFPTAPQAGQQVAQAANMPAGPMVQQDTANDQRMNYIARLGEQERAVMQERGTMERAAVERGAMQERAATQERGDSRGSEDYKKRPGDNYEKRRDRWRGRRFKWQERQNAERRPNPGVPVPPAE
jgi:hypothetical protein